MKISEHLSSLWEASSKGARFSGTFAMGVLSAAENRFGFFSSYTEADAIGDADAWVNQGGFPPKAVLCSLAVAGSMAVGATVAATNHVVRSVFAAE